MVVEEPGRLRVIIVIMWVVAVSYFLGAIGFGAAIIPDAMTTHGSISSADPVSVALFCTIPYHALVAAMAMSIAVGLHRRRRWVRAALPWLFAGTLLIQLAYAIAVVILVLFVHNGGWGLLLIITAMVRYLFPMVAYIVVMIFALVQLRHPGVRALFERR